MNVSDTTRGRCAMAVAFALGATLATAQYTATRICTAGSFTNRGGYKINRSGQISGMNGTTNAPFLWSPNAPNGTPGTLKTLGSIKSAPAQAHGLNNLGDVVGTVYQSSGRPLAVLWSGSTTPAAFAGTSTFQTEAESINDAGDILFLYNDARANDCPAVSRIVSGKRKTYLVPGGYTSYWPRTINALSQVMDLGGGFWTPNAAKTAWSLANVFPLASADMNDSGAAVGAVVSGGGYTFDRPAVYVPSFMYNLPAGLTNLYDQVTAALSSVYPWQFNTNCSATAISTTGLMVGGIDSNNLDHVSAAWVRDPAGAISQITALGWSHIAPHDVNDNGQIVATAVSDADGLTYCILLTL